MLDRLRSDCEYFLNYGNRNLSRLRCSSVDEHIKDMRELYSKLPEPPQWLTLEKINEYELLMK